MRGFFTRKDWRAKKRTAYFLKIPDPYPEKRDVNERVFDQEGLESEEEDSILI